MLRKMTAQKRADIQWAVVRIQGAELFPNRNQALFMQSQIQQLPELRKLWDKMDNDPEYKAEIMKKYGGGES